MSPMPKRQFLKLSLAATATAAVVMKPSTTMRRRR